MVPRRKVRVGSVLSEEFSMQVGAHAREGLMNEILYADDLILTSENIKNLKLKFLEWKEAFESKVLKVNLKKTKVMVSGSKVEVFPSKVDSCAKYRKRAMENSVMSTKCSKWVHGSCAKTKRVTSTLVNGFICERFVEAMKRIVKSNKELTFYDQVEVVKSFCYSGDRLNAYGGSEAAVTAKARIGWIKFREFGELPNGRKLSLKMKGQIGRSCAKARQSVCWRSRL